MGKMMKPRSISKMVGNSARTFGKRTGSPVKAGATAVRRAVKPAGAIKAMGKAVKRLSTAKFSMPGAKSATTKRLEKALYKARKPASRSYLTPSRSLSKPQMRKRFPKG